MTILEPAWPGSLYSTPINLRSPMINITAKDSGKVTLGGDLTVNRLGFGAMRITGKDIWGDPADPAEARRVLRRVPELDIDFIDTADAYGPFVSEDLIRDELHPY